MNFYFKPTYTFTFVVFILLSILLSLGFWQLHRAEEKRLLQAKFDARIKATPITLEQAEKLRDNFYYPVQAEGHFDNAHSFLLDNQFYHHRVGYQVITPFLTEKTHRWILINRGWVPMKPNRELAIKIPAISDKVQIKGFLHVPQNNPFISDEIESISWPLRIERLNIPSLSNRLNRALYPAIMLLDPQNPYGFIRQWQPISMKAATHTGYAVQWFAMAGVLLVIYLGTSIKRNEPKS